MGKIKVHPSIGGVKRSFKSRFDPRHFKHSKAFGAAPAALPTEDFDVAPKFFVKDQGASSFCVSFATMAAMEAHLGFELAPEWNRAKICQLMDQVTCDGVDPDLGIKAAKQFGAITPANCPTKTLVDTCLKVGDWTQYPKNLDALAATTKEISSMVVEPDFNSIRWAMQNGRLAGFPTAVMVGTRWRAGWLNAPGNVIDVNNRNEAFTEHEFAIVGQKNIGGILYLKAHLSSGKNRGNNGFFYFSANIVNDFQFARCFALGSPDDYKKQLWGLLAYLFDLLMSIRSFFGKIFGLIFRK